MIIEKEMARHTIADGRVDRVRRVSSKTGPAPRRGRCSANTDASAAVVHRVCCPYCQTPFNLFTAAWCGHQDGQPSKRCPSCQRCLCRHPAYMEPHFWKEAPPAFQRRGFDRLFLFYL